MATATFVHDGKSIDYTPGADVSAGDVVVQQGLVGVAKLDIASGALGALAVTGVFDFPCDPGDTGVPVGVQFYWDVGNGYATTQASGPALGKNVVATGSPVTTVRVRLGQ
jgi:predicted RecA/RadA family phage recombinase